LTIRAEVEGLGVLEFPDGTSGAVIDMTVQRELAALRGATATNPAAANPDAVTPLGTISGEVGGNLAFNPAAALISAGDWFSKVNRGLLEAKHAPAEWLTGRPSPFMESVRQDRAFAEQPMRELEAVHPGSSTIGKVGAMAAIPPALLPAVAAAEEGSIGERALRGGAVLGGQLATKAAGRYLAAAPERAKALQMANKPRDEILAMAQKEGYVFPPSTAGGGGVSRLLEGLSGKAKTEQLGTVRNQPVTDRLARLEMKLPENVPLKPETFKAIRAEAYQTGYRPIVDLPVVKWDKPFVKELSKLAPNSGGGAVKNPATEQIDDLVKGLASQKQWSGSQVVGDIQRLREMARANFGSAAREGGNSAKLELAHAQSKAAEMLEKLAERQIMKNGGDVGAVKALHEARRTIAKSHAFEEALVNGSVDLHALASRAGPQATGYTKLMAELGGDKALRKSVGMPVAGASNPVTVLDAFGTAAGGAGGLGLGALAWPAGRMASRYGIMSRPYQQMFVKPNYAPSLASRGAPLLANPYAPALTGLFGYEATH
jgi:hypothetical protein